MGNLGSVDKALRYVGCEVQVTSAPQVIADAAGIVLPGVGAFDDCMANLHQYDLVAVIKEAVAAGKPFLGICLGIIPGEVVRFKHDLKIPQIGWNQISIKREAPHLAGTKDGAWVYFVHSYYVVPEDDSVIATTTEYGYEFCSSIWRENIFASQFHPEKSQAVGLQLLQKFG